MLIIIPPDKDVQVRGPGGCRKGRPREWKDEKKWIQVNFIIKIIMRQWILLIAF